MDLMKIAAEIFLSKIGGSKNLDEGNVMSALMKLLPTNGSGLDIAALIQQFTEGGAGEGLASMVGSWLGDGDNSSMSISQVLSIFGQGKIQDFAQSLHLDTDTASKGLSDMLPELIDKSSTGGSLLDSLGGDDAMGALAKGALGALFK